MSKLIDAIKKCPQNALSIHMPQGGFSPTTFAKELKRAGVKYGSTCGGSSLYNQANPWIRMLASGLILPVYYAFSQPYDSPVLKITVPLGYGLHMDSQLLITKGIPDLIHAALAKSTKPALNASNVNKCSNTQLRPDGSKWMCMDNLGHVASCRFDKPVYDNDNNN